MIDLDQAARKRPERPKFNQRLAHLLIGFGMQAEEW